MAPITEGGSGDGPAEYDGAAYAIDRATHHANREEWEDAADRVREALDRVAPAPYPHLTGRLRRQATDVVLSADRERPDAELIATRLAGMQAAVASMTALAYDGASTFPDGGDP